MNTLNHLLWKEWRQMKPLVVVLFVILLFIQGLYFCLQVVDRHSGYMLFGSYIAFVAPSLMALAASGIMVGREQETRTWNWSTSLPISWHQAFVSKLLIWLAGSLILFVPLYLTHLLLFAVSQTLGIFIGPPNYAEDMTIAIEVAMLVAAIEVYIFSNVAVLCMSDTLLAMAISAFVVAIFHTIFNVDSAYPGSWFAQLSTALRILHTIAIIAALLGFAAIFRWRWTSGQYAIGWIPNYRSLSGKSQPGMWATYGNNGRVPGLSKTLWMHGVRSAWMIRTVVVLFGCFVIWLMPGLTPICVYLATVTLGVTVFAPDRTSQRYRFYADRGVNGLAILLSHCLIPLLGVSLLVGVASALDTTGALSLTSHPIAICASVFSLFLVGVLASVCYANATVAMAASMLAGFISLIIISVYLSYWDLISYRYETADRLLTHMVVQLAFASGIVIAGIVIAVKELMLRQSFHGWRIFLAAVCLAVFAPLTGDLFTRFLFVPRVPWVGSPENEVLMPQQLLVELETKKRIEWTKVRRQFRNETLRYLEGKKLNGLIKLHESLGQIPGDGFSREECNKEIQAINQCSRAAIENQDFELLAASFKASRSLLDIAGQDPILAAITVEAREETWGIWWELKAMQPQVYAEMEKQYAIDELLPVMIPYSFWEQLLTQQATAAHLLLRYSDDELEKKFPYLLRPAQRLRYLLSFNTALQQNATNSLFIRKIVVNTPPIRWYAERTLAVVAQEQIDLARKGMWKDISPWDSLWVKVGMMYHMQQSFHSWP